MSRSSIDFARHSAERGALGPCFRNAVSASHFDGWPCL
jgi:hypothetical protein